MSSVYRLVSVIASLFILLMPGPVPLVQSKAASPEGLIVFTSDRDSGSYQLYTMNADGSNVKQLTKGTGNDESYAPRWSPDGTRLRYVYVPPRGAGVRMLKIIKADGTGEITLTDDRAIDVVGFSRWSPDSKKLFFGIFLKDPPRQAEFYTVNADGTGRTLIAPRGEVPLNSESAWTPDGKLLIGVSSGLYIVDADGKNPKLILDRTPWAYDLSSDGKLIGVVDLQGIYTINIDGSNRRTLLELTAGVVPQRLLWSPDGKQMAVNLHFPASGLQTSTTTSKTARQSGTYLINADGSNFKWISEYTEIAWSPDSKYIIYTVNVGENSQVFVANSDGTNPVQITKEGNNAHADWMPVLKVSTQ